MLFQYRWRYFSLFIIGKRYSEQPSWKGSWYCLPSSFYRVSLLPLFRWDEHLMKGAVRNAVAFPLQWPLNDLKEMQGLGGAWSGSLLSSTSVFMGEETKIQRVWQTEPRCSFRIARPSSARGVLVHVSPVGVLSWTCEIQCPERGLGVRQTWIWMQLCTFLPSIPEQWFSLTKPPLYWMVIKCTF